MTDYEKKRYIEIKTGEKNVSKMIHQRKILQELTNKIPQKFYRYRALTSEYEIDNIMNNRIWLSKPTEFNDPYDSMINIDVKQMIEKYFKYDSNLRQEYDRLERKDKRELDRFIESERKKVQKEITYELEELRNSVGIACFSETHDNLLMWSHYGGYHRGICLEYDARDIIAKFVFLPVIYTDLFENVINYIDMKNDSVKDKAVVLFLNKSKDWRYEKEWRILELFPEDSVDVGILENLKPKKIIMGCRISNSNEKEIKKISKKNGISLEKMQLDKTRFRVFYK